MKPIIIHLYLILVLLSKESFCQDSLLNPYLKNAVFVEFGGAAGIYSVNYQRIYFQKGILKLSMSGGLSFMPLRNKFPLTIIIFSPQLLLGSAHNFEVGFKYSLSYEYDLNYYGNGTFDNKWEYNLNSFYGGFLGYHYRNPQNGFLFRLGYSPIIQRLYLNSDFFHWMNFTHWFGIGVGTAF